MDKIIFPISNDINIYIPLIVPESVLHLYAVGSIILARAGHDTEFFNRLWIDR
jgi:hypothetical protein